METITYATAQAENTEGIMSAVFNHISNRLNIPITAVHDISWQERIRRVADGRIDVGWICGSYYARLADEDEPVVELLAAPVMAQARYQGRPVYFSDVVVRADSPFQRFDDLRGASFAYNEPGSMSGYWTMRYHLAENGSGDGYFGRVTGSGGHLNSIGMILAGEVDTAAIDSMVMSAELEERPELASQLRVVATLGPTPIPPWVIRRAVPEARKSELHQALLALPQTEDGRALLAAHHLHGFAAVSDSHYDQVRMMIRKAGEVAW